MLHIRPIGQDMKMIIPLQALQPNPFRDFTVDPIDDPSNDNDEIGHVSAVTKLRESIEEDGFWGGVVIRKSPAGNGTYEIAAGHHRIEAAKLAGMTEADLVVLSLDDDAMIRVYGRENATQRGTMSTAVAGTVAAALRKVARDRAVCADDSINANPMAREQTIGRPALMPLLRGIPDLTENKINEQLAILKDSGDYRRIVTEVAEEARREKERMEREAEEARLAAEEAERLEQEAEERRRQAEELAREAKAKADRKRAEERAKQEAIKEQEARERAEVDRRLAKEAEARAEQARQAEQAADKTAHKADDPKFDKNFDYQGVTKWLHNDNQVRAFRKWATAPGIKPYLPVSSQHLIAKALAVKAMKEKVELSAAFIHREASNMLARAKDVEQKDQRKAQEALEEKSRQDKARHWQEQFSRQCRGMLRAGTELAALQKTWPKGTSFPITQEFKNAIADAKNVIDKLQKEIN